MKKTFLFLLLSLTIGSASARLFGISATLNGTSEVPTNASTATGTVFGIYDDVSLQLNLTITFNGLAANVSAAYIHRAAVGVNGPVQISLSGAPAATSGTFSYSGTLTAPQAADLLAGLYYVNIHSASFPGGEIRGQLAVGMAVFNASTINDFNGIGGYSYTQETFPNGMQSNPYVVTGPSPQNSFTYTASATGGINNVSFSISTSTINTPITIQFKGNNVRKFGCRAFASIFGGGGTTSDAIQLTATTNLGNTAVMNGSTSNLFVGFRVLNENEYITSIQATFLNITASVIALKNIVVGDDQAQNVALNFDGVNDYVSTNANVGNFNTNDDFTVTCWIKPDPTQTTQSGQNPDENDIISKWAGLGAGVNNNYPFVIRYLNSTRATVAERGKILVGQWDGTTFTTLISTTAVNDGRWHHVAFVRDIGFFRLYINGNFEGSAPDNVNNTTTNTTPLQFGRRGNSESYFKGEIDEIRIWTVSKTATEIQNEMFCKNPITTNLQAAYNFNNGVPNGNNALITQVQDAVGSNHGTLNNFAQTGDISNWVTGQVKYVRINIPTITSDGSSWENGYHFLQNALTANACNDLFEVYVLRGIDFPDLPNNANDINQSYIIPAGMKIYGGFAGTEKNINERNMALIHTTNETTLTGDLGQNDTPFNFASNRTDNSFTPVQITGNNVVFDGFTVSGASVNGAGIAISGTNVTVKNSRVIDNANRGFTIFGDNATIANCSIMGNNDNGIFINNPTSTIIKESLMANNGSGGISIFVTSGTKQTTITNSTIASNADYGIKVFASTGTTLTNTLKNTLIYGNATGGVFNNGGGITNAITYSLVQGITTGTGNLNGNTVNPQFVSPLANTVRSDLGNYRLKWCSLAIGAGNNTGITPLDLDRNPRNFNGTAGMGAYEFLGNTPSQVNNSSITGTIDVPVYAGGAIQTITSTAKILAPAGAIDFKAPNSITLNPGFEARGVGKYFKAQIGANVVCVN